MLALVGHVDLVAALVARLDRLDAATSEIERRLDTNDDRLDADTLERANAELIDLKDAVWAIRNDRLRTAREVEMLAGTRRTSVGARWLSRRAAGVLGHRPT